MKVEKPKPFKIPEQTEKELTAGIRYLLKSQGIWHFKNFGGPMSVKGLPDLIGCFGGRFLAIEVKRKSGKVSPEQEVMIARINRAGGLAFVARDLETVIEKLGIKDRFLF